MAEVEKRKSGGLSLLEGVVLVGVGVGVVLFLIAIVHVVVGVLWGTMKFIALIAAIIGILWLVFRRR